MLFYPLFWGQTSSNYALGGRLGAPPNGVKPQIYISSNPLIMIVSWGSIILPSVSKIHTFFVDLCYFTPFSGAKPAQVMPLVADWGRHQMGVKPQIYIV